MNLAIIPARGGSKRIPRKNIRLFSGKPIIKYSIDAARKSNCFEEVMVSTDDKKIAVIAEQYGANVPFFRSKKNSTDFATLGQVCEEVINYYKKMGKVYDYFACILPTAPFITAKKIQAGYKLIRNHNIDAVVTVTKFSYPIYRAFHIKDNMLKMIWPDKYNVRSQDIEPAFHDVGQFYWLKTEAFLKQKIFFCKKTMPVEIPEFEAQDIDTEEDWKIAERKFKIFNNN